MYQKGRAQPFNKQGRLKESTGVLRDPSDAGWQDMRGGRKSRRQLKMVQIGCRKGLKQARLGGQRIP
jgi:hypothetical protein